MNESPTTGLRERKRAKTAAAIHAAAVELVLERGLDAATIDAISERADVSTRTFFNYFRSKEDAVLGIDERAVAEELDRARDSTADPVDALFDLLYTLFEASGGGHAGRRRTREAMHAHPQLITRQMLRVADLEDRLSGIVAGWLASDARFAADSDEVRLEEARIVVGICLATVRVSMKRWANESEPERGSPASGDPRPAYEHSIATFRSVLEKLT